MSELPIVLIVDDNPSGRDTLTALLMTEKIEVVTACNGVEAIEKAVQLQPDLILLDVMMPGMDGFEVCRHLRQDPQLAEVPIVLVTALDDRESKLQGLTAGADDYITRPIDRAELRARVRTILRLNRYRKKVEERLRFEKLYELSPNGILMVAIDGEVLMMNPAATRILCQDPNQPVIGQKLLDLIPNSEAGAVRTMFAELVSGTRNEIRCETQIQSTTGDLTPVELYAGMVQWEYKAHLQIILHDITEQKQSEYRLKTAYADLENALEDTISGWARALELRDNETEGHTRRVVEMTMRICSHFDIDENRLKDIRRGAILHDIGKIGVPDAILLKPGKLDEDEWKIMQRHPEYAHKFLSSILFLTSAMSIPLCHHEKWDGSGYPQHFKGTEIPLEARIFSIADVYDALTSDRPYHKAWSQEDALDFIHSRAGTDFDPQIVETFIKMMQEEE